MDFEKSTQARAWIFDRESLEACRRKAVSHDLSSPATESGTKPQKFASGFHSRYHATHAADISAPASPALTVDEQEMLVRFHAHQIETLVGPTAILTQLRTSETVASTAVTFFRRFYLSNSIAAIHPRKMAVACAFFASKVEEERVEIDALAHATKLIRERVQSAPLCRQELCVVSPLEIELHERMLMEGLNYEFRCHHPHEDLHLLVANLSNFLSKDNDSCDGRDPLDCYSLSGGDKSPRGAATYTFQYSDELLDRAYELTHQVLVFSDAPFLFAPSHLALAVLAISLDAAGKGGRLDCPLKDYLRTTLPENSEQELDDLADKVHAVMSSILECSYLNLMPCELNWNEMVAKRAESLRIVLGKVSNLRLLEEMRRQEEAAIAARRHRKRYREFELYYTPHSNAPHNPRWPRVSRVTPTSCYYF